MENKKINVGIGFVTGRKNFKNVLRAYLSGWSENVLPDKKKYALHLFVAYDLNYSGTKVGDYNIVEEDLLKHVDSALYLGDVLIANEARMLREKKVADAKELRLILGEGYAMKRNAVLYFALKSKMDYLIFLDDDEYPLANLRMGAGVAWEGQEVLAAHLKSLPTANLTHGHHCGYISPIPSLGFNDLLSEGDFRMLIEALSNDILTWESVKQKMAQGGVTYADPEIIDSQRVTGVKKIGGMKFISGANLGINLKDPEKLFPFYNPPNARGEDAFLSTCLDGYEIKDVPCYTFHDGFLKYPSLLCGVLPHRLQAVDIAQGANYRRFLKAAVGWIRYKPLLLWITCENYEAEISAARNKLAAAVPKLCAYFGNEDFRALPRELDFYDAHVKEHFRDFTATKEVWRKIVAYLTQRGAPGAKPGAGPT